MVASSSPDDAGAIRWPATGRRGVLAAGGALLLGTGSAADAAGPESIHALSARMYDGDVAFSKYKGQVVLVLNVASE